MKKIVVIIFIGIYLAWFSFFMANYTSGSDFPVFYYAACTIFDPSSSNILIYDPDLYNKYSAPDIEFRLGNNFIYSLPIAFVFSPLCLLPYYNAKAVLIFLGIFCYLLANAITLHLNQTKSRWFIYPLALSYLFLPFIQDLRMAQVNAFILVLVSFSTLFAIRRHPYLCGSLLALAGLFKIYPIAIAMVLGLKNWRIIISCTIIFTSSFLIPNSLEWIPSISKIYRADYVPLFLILGPYWFVLYAATMAVLTACIVLYTKGTDYPLLVSFAIPAVFLTMPIVEYYHLVLMAQPYIHIFTKYKTDRFLVGLLIVSLTFISIAFFYNHSKNTPADHLFSKHLITYGLLSFWGTLAWKLSRT